jgi:hypothetical protein
VAEIRRLNAIAATSGDLVQALKDAPLTSTRKLLLAALSERLEAPATGREKDAKTLAGRGSRPLRGPAA